MRAAIRAGDGGLTRSVRENRVSPGQEGILLHWSRLYRPGGRQVLSFPAVAQALTTLHGRVVPRFLVAVAPRP